MVFSVSNSEEELGLDLKAIEHKEVVENCRLFVRRVSGSRVMPITQKRERDGPFQVLCATFV